MSQTERPSRLVRPLLHAAALVLCIGAATALSAGGAEARARHHHHALPSKKPVLVELFTAQGCATCQPADAVLADLAKRKEVLALTFSVDIWDFLGWPDTFAQPEFTARQRAYVKRLRLREMSTPQMVVQGAAHSAGLDPDEVGGLIDAAERPKTPTITISKGAKRVNISRGFTTGAPADVWLVRYDPKVREVKIKTGESRGKTVSEIDVVRQLVRLGSWTGTAKSWTLPAYTPPSTASASAAGTPALVSTPASTIPAETLKAAVIVQSSRSGEVLAIGRD